MKSITTLLAIAAAASLAGRAPVQSMTIPERPQIRHSENEPKCKTCIHFRSSYRCNDPMRMSCEAYKRKKKKR